MLKIIGCLKYIYIYIYIERERERERERENLQHNTVHHKIFTEKPRLISLASNHFIQSSFSILLQNLYFI